MKFIIMIISVLLSSSCSSISSTEGNSASKPKLEEFMLEKDALDDLNKAIALASNNKDYRLLVTSGRSMTIPGVKSSDYQEMIALCGKKYNPATGDVIRSEAQRLARKKEINYMRQYNEQILALCKENNNYLPRQ